MTEIRTKTDLNQYYPTNTKGLRYKQPFTKNTYNTITVSEI